MRFSLSEKNHAGRTRCEGKLMDVPAGGLPAVP